MRDSCQADDDFGLISLAQTAPSEEKKKTVTQYLELQCTKGTFKDTNNGSAISKVVVHWEAKSTAAGLGSPCAVM